MYCYNEQGSLEFLLTKSMEEKSYHEISGTVLEADSTSILAAARIMVQQLRGCFSDCNLQRLLEGEKLTEDNLLPSRMTFYEMWDQSQFFEWIRKFVENSLTIEVMHGKLILLLEIPKFKVENLKCFKTTHFKWVTNETLKKSKETEQALSVLANEYDIPLHIEIASLARETDVKRETFIVLSCKPVDKATAVDPLYLHFPALFQGLFRRAGEQWIHYNAAIDEFPSEEQMRNVKAIIIPGSSSSVYDPHEGIGKLKQWIRDFDKKYPRVRMMGICFGAQIICEALGGKVDKMEPRKKDPNFYLCASETLKPSDEFFELPFVKKGLSDAKARLSIVEAHGDEITELPLGFRTLASSNTCRNEFIVSENGRYLGLQGHPEYSPEFITAKKTMILSQDDSELYPWDKFDEFNKEFLMNDFREFTSCESLRAICYSFLKQE